MAEPNIRAFAPEPRALFALALVLVLFAVAWRIPLPGLDLDRLSQMAAMSTDGASRFSIFALGIIPYFTVLAYLEVARLAVSPLARWQAQSTGNARWFALVAFLLALAMTVWQAYPLLQAYMLPGTDLVRRDAVAFVPAALATYLAATASIVWLADRIRLRNLGDGFWLIMAVPLLSDFPTSLAYVVDLARMGAISANILLAFLLLLVVAIGLVVFANRLLAKSDAASGAERASILLWPPYLAAVASTQIVGLLQNQFSSEYLLLSNLNLIYLALAAMLIPIFTLAYGRMFRITHPEGQRRWPLPVLLLVVAIQVLLVLGAEIAPLLWGLPFATSGAELLVLGTVMLALMGSGGARA